MFGLSDIIAKGALKGRHFAIILAMSFVGRALIWVPIAPNQLTGETLALTAFWPSFHGR